MLHNKEIEPNVKVIIGMSGGVDSSVSALLLKQQGFDVEGLFMKNWNDDDGTEYCTAMTDLMDAAAVCQTLGIHLHTVNFAKEYWDKVFTYFLQEYRAGRTPNPDILCNREIKFNVFLDYADSLGAHYIATGHYVRVRHAKDPSTPVALLKGLDANKDQSYFLHAVPGSALNRSLFPIGAMHKSDVRALAEKNGLVTHNKKDSTGICFIGERRFKDFLQHYLPARPGPIVTDRGKTIGEHQGLMYHTIGQRQGLGIGGQADSSGEPWYVASKDLDSNELMVVQGSQNPLLFTNALKSSTLHWVSGGVPQDISGSFMAKTRYRQEDQMCYLEKAEQEGCFNIYFDEAQRAITPGQSVVLYRNDACLGGGIIESTSNS